MKDSKYCQLGVLREPCNGTIIAAGAQVIVLSEQGQNLDQIIAATGLSQTSVNKWRQRFRSYGLQGLWDAPHMRIFTFRP